MVLARLGGPLSIAAGHTGERLTVVVWNTGKGDRCALCSSLVLDELQSHRSRGVIHCLQLARPVMGAAASLHADQAD
jgi:hypothetical protein